MEEFAATEKAKLGISSPLSTRFDVSNIRGRLKAQDDSNEPTSNPLPPLDSTATEHQVEASLEDQQPRASTSTQPQDEGAFAESSRPQRHRKLSQSNPHPRLHRKGIGGKMALFETAAHDGPAGLTSRLGLGGQGGLPSGPSYDHIAGVPSTAGINNGILNTGHDRPYRFSFYSNALSATIHARSLSELPAEGQTFEQLFSGVHSERTQNGTSTNPIPFLSPNPMKDRPPSSMAFTPPMSDPAKFRSADMGNISNSLNQNLHRRSFGQAEKSTVATANGVNEDVNTWWLDVLSPTDEEMKMLSKVLWVVL